MNVGSRYHELSALADGAYALLCVCSSGTDSGHHRESSGIAMHAAAEVHPQISSEWGAMQDGVDSACDTLESAQRASDWNADAQQVRKALVLPLASFHTVALCKCACRDRRH